MSRLPAAAIDVPFRIKRDEPLIILSATINGKGPFDLVLDTGASHTVLTPGVARLTGIKAKKSRAKAVGLKGSLAARPATVRSLKIGPLEERRVRVVVVELTRLNRTLRRKVGGILGYNVLRRYRITIDYRAKLIGFHATKAAARVKSAGTAS